MNKIDKDIILYMHAGSKNHGCEAIANSLGSMLSDSLNKRIKLITYRAAEDKEYSLNKMYEIIQEKDFSNHKLMHLILYVYRMITKDKESFLRFRYGNVLSKSDQSGKYPLAISIGGDNYCYDVMLNDLKLANGAFNNQGTKTVLLGCSIEPEIVANKNILDDLNKYSLVIARESITYDALNKRLDDSSKVIMCPDPAFTLEPIETGLPGIYVNDAGVVGINISPMIQNNENVEGITLKNYEHLIEHILSKTDMNVALIPHVVWNNNDDRIPIGILYEKYKDTGRICKIEDTDCQRLKYIISKCRFFVGARTHSTIAAYSSMIPTLVVGYSVKARGIAKDIGMEDYVLPVQSLAEENKLTGMFINMQTNEENIRNHFKKIMPEYIDNARQNGTKILELLN